MKVTVKTSTSELQIELPGDMDLSIIHALLSGEVGMSEVVLSVDGKVLQAAEGSLQACGVTEDTVVHITAPGEAVPIPGVSQAELARATQFIQQVKSDPYTLSLLKQNNPPMAEAVEKNDLKTISKIMQDQEKARREAALARQQRLAALEADPFNVEAQRALEREIQEGNVEQMRQEAIEHMPEVFASVVMLYIDVVVNGIPLKAFVDSGAQMTIMSAACAERCGLMRLCDRRFEGMAVGVGTQRILGRVHMCQLQIENNYLPTSLSILEKQDMEMLLGLDMLKRHRCVIDLDKGVLRIGTTGTSTPFLPESELPPSARPNNKAPPEPSAQAQKFEESDITELMSLGSFSRQQAIEALTVSSGDRGAAAAYLLDSIANS
eukprot:m.17858 g.17858  ORF g.17858 m.17858 type:complete len:379 (+) comp6130_c0_seq2:107-1243(+)